MHHEIHVALNGNDANLIPPKKEKTLLSVSFSLVNIYYYGVDHVVCFVGGYRILDMYMHTCILIFLCEFLVAVLGLYTQIHALQTTCPFLESRPTPQHMTTAHDQ